MVLLGTLFVYGGVTGKSVIHLIFGDNKIPRNPPGGGTYVSPGSTQSGNPSSPTGKTQGSGVLGTVGKIIGMPFQGTHSKATNVAGGSDNWQSENAIDVSVPIGTPIYAPTSGTVERAGALPGNPGGRFAGLRVTLQGTGNAFYFAHLSRVAVTVGQKIQPGELLGYTGEANGVAHLHFATENGSPLDWILKH